MPIAILILYYSVYEIDQRPQMLTWHCHIELMAHPAGNVIFRPYVRIDNFLGPIKIFYHLSTLL